MRSSIRSLRVLAFPGTNTLSCPVEQPLVVSNPNGRARRWINLRKDAIPQVEHPKLCLLVGRRYVVCAEEEAIRILPEELRCVPLRLRRADRVFGDLIPGDVEVHVLQSRMGQQSRQDLQVGRVDSLRARSRLRLRWMYHATQ